jgi:hypothetical protein
MSITIAATAATPSASQEFSSPGDSLNNVQMLWSDDVSTCIIHTPDDEIHKQRLSHVYGFISSLTAEEDTRIRYEAYQFAIFHPTDCVKCDHTNEQSCIRGVKEYCMTNPSMWQHP